MAAAAIFFAVARSIDGPYGGRSFAKALATPSASIAALNKLIKVFLSDMFFSLGSGDRREHDTMGRLGL
jgi:hypothetical protein